MNQVDVRPKSFSVELEIVKINSLATVVGHGSRPEPIAFPKMSLNVVFFLEGCFQLKITKIQFHLHYCHPSSTFPSQSSEVPIL